MKKTSKKPADKVNVTFQFHVRKDPRNENIDKTLSELQEKVNKRLDKIGSVIYYLLFFGVALSAIFSIQDGDFRVAMWKISTLLWIFLYRFKELENRRIEEVADSWYKKLMEFYDKDIENSLKHLDIVVDLHKKLSETKKLLKNALEKLAKSKIKKRVSRRNPKRR